MFHRFVHGDVLQYHNCLGVLLPVRLIQIGIALDPMQQPVEYAQLPDSGAEEHQLFQWLEKSRSRIFWASIISFFILELKLVLSFSISLIGICVFTIIYFVIKETDAYLEKMASNHSRIRHRVLGYSKFYTSFLPKCQNFSRYWKSNTYANPMHLKPLLLSRNVHFYSIDFKFKRMYA